MLDLIAKYGALDALKRVRETLCAGRRVLSSLIATTGLTVTLVLCLPAKAKAAPETWFNPAQTLTGSPSSGFGSAISCSSEIGGLQYSYFAVGAPSEASGEGQVHIYGPTGRIQTLGAPMPRSTGNFGYAVLFVKDINGDSLDELAIGEPDSDLGGTGMLHMYLSSGVPAEPYVHCGTRTGSKGFGSFILQTISQVAGGVQLVVGNPDAAEINAFNITDVGSACSFVHTSDFQSSGPNGAGTRYGQSIAGSDNVAWGYYLLVGAPRDLFGVVYTKGVEGSPGPLYSGNGNGANEQFGVAITSRFDSGLIAFNAPYSDGGSNTVYVKSRMGPTFSDFCSLSVPMADLSEFAAQSLAHLDTAFDGFVSAGGGGTAFATYRTEAATGGSVGLFGATSTFGQCSSVKQVNNCASDPGQKQGQVLVGGPTCIGGSGRKLLIVGAPGYSNNAGRVDVYEEGTELGVALPCGVPTNTPTATPTPTVSATATPKAMPIVEPTATSIPGFDGSVIPADPQTSGLPAPRILPSGTGVMAIEAAMVVTKDKRFPFIGWLFSITSRSAKPQSSSGVLVEALAASTKKRQLFSKRNRVSLRNLKPGTYTIAYQPVFRRASGKNRNARVLGRMSSPATFTVR